MSLPVSLGDAKEIIQRVIQNKIQQPILLVGESGIGKSSLIKDVAEENDLPLEDIRLAQHEPADLTGIPYREDKMTLWGRPSILRDGRFILFLDEINRGPIESRNAVFQLCTEWKIQTHELHPETVIVAAINPAESKTAFQVEMLDPAMIRRFLILHVTVTPEEWLKWASSKAIPQSILSFIQTNKKWLNIPKSNEPFPCPATWTALGRFITDKDEDSFILRAGCGLVGEEATTAFVQYYRNAYDPAVEAMQVFKDFNSIEARLKKQTNDQHYQTSLSIFSEIERRSKNKEKKLLSETEIESFIKYLKSIPKEFVSGLFPQLAKLEDPKFYDVYNIITKDKYIADIGASLSKYLMAKNA